jgi:hypothetical protein
MSINIATYQAEVNDLNARALKEQNDAIAAFKADHKTSTDWANNWKKENTAYLAQMLKDGQLSKADHDNEVKNINAEYTRITKEINDQLAQRTKDVQAEYQTRLKESADYLKEKQAEVTAGQQRVKTQYETQKKLSAEAKKQALADLAFEKALYTPADYNKKVADINADYARIDDSINTAYTTIQQAPAERIQQYLEGGIGSLSYAQELLAKSKQAAAAPATPAPSAASVSTAYTPPQALALDTSRPTISPTAPVATPSQLTGTDTVPTTISAEEQARARAAITSGLGTSPALPSFPTMPAPPTGPQQPPPAAPSPYGDIFSKEQQFPSLLQGAANPYMPQQQPLVPNLTPQPLQVGGAFPGLQQTTGQTMPAQPALPALTTGLGIVPTNPYLDAYQGMIQSARPPEETVPGAPGTTLPVAPVTPVAQTTGMF